MKLSTSTTWIRLCSDRTYAHFLQTPQQEVDPGVAVLFQFSTPLPGVIYKVLKIIVPHPSRASGLGMHSHTELHSEIPFKITVRAKDVQWKLLYTVFILES